ALNNELYLSVGPIFWSLHRMLPLVTLAMWTAARPHPEVAEWLRAKTRERLEFLADLPKNIELAARRLGVEIDPDQVLHDYLSAKGILRTEQLPHLATLRSIVAEPLPGWLLLREL